MKILESEKQREINPLIGLPIRKGVVGSTTYYVRHCHVNGNPCDILAGHKAIFQLYSGGLLIRTFKSDKRMFVLLPYHDVVGFRLKKGDEEISPIMLSPFWILLKLGVKVEVARYFKAGNTEYSIAETRLEITLSTGKIILETNGYTFNGQARFFNKIGISEKLEVLP